MSWLKLLLSQSIPKEFRLVFRFDEQSASQLGQQILPGVKGISSSGQIAMQFFGVAREAMLLMSAEQVLSMNAVEKIDYSNPDAMMEDNMAMLYRIFDQTYHRTATENVLTNVLTYGIGSIAKNRKEFAEIYYLNNYMGLLRKMGNMAGDEQKQFNSVDELAAWAAQAAPIAAKKQGYEAVLDVSLWKELIYAGLSYMSQIYSDEGEWIIQNGGLKIPTGSVLYIMIPEIPDDVRAKWESDERELMKFIGWDYAFNRAEQFESLVKTHGLDRIYRIRWVGEKSFKNRRTKYYEK